MQNDNPVRYLRSPEAVAYLQGKGVSLALTTLATMACRGGGPRFQKNGKVRVYTDQELDAFATKRLGPLVASTSELAATRAT